MCGYCLTKWSSSFNSSKRLLLVHLVVTGSNPLVLIIASNICVVHCDIFPEPSSMSEDQYL